MSKRVAVLGGGGFIGGHLAKRLKNEGCSVRIADLKRHEYFRQDEICDDYKIGDLGDPTFVRSVIDEGFDEVYQLAADMGGAGYIFTGFNDANVMSNSALINLNVVKACVEMKVGRVFYSSSACMYPAYNQEDPLNPNCEESSAYPANPDSEYGWEKLFSERLYLAFHRNYSLDVRVARYHNIFGPFGTWTGGKEKAPAAMLRKACEAETTESIEVWGDGRQTRSFLYVDDCIDATLALFRGDFIGPVNIGSDEMVNINELASMAIEISGKNLAIDNLSGVAFHHKYGFDCPVGVRGRNSDNRLIEKELGWRPKFSLKEGLKATYPWVAEQVKTVS